MDEARAGGDLNRVATALTEQLQERHGANLSISSYPDQQAAPTYVELTGASVVASQKASNPVPVAQGSLSLDNETFLLLQHIRFDDQVTSSLRGLEALLEQ